MVMVSEKAMSDRSKCKRSYLKGTTAVPMKGSYGRYVQVRCTDVDVGEVRRSGEVEATTRHNRAASLRHCQYDEADLIKLSSFVSCNRVPVTLCCGHREVVAGGETQDIGGGGPFEGNQGIV
jgi:hypothetical protein